MQSNNALFAKTRVLVSIAPQKFLVESIGNDHVTVDVIVPPGASSHTYEPTPKQMLMLQKGAIWFRLGESFEKRLIPACSHMQIIDQREGISLLFDTDCQPNHKTSHCCHCQGADLHIWLSPNLLKQQARQIEAVLSAHDPKHAELYAHNLHALETTLTDLDREISIILKQAPKIIMVSHPAFGYLCRDYGLTQLPIEIAGHEPTPRYLLELIAKARSLNVQTIFLQKQHATKGGKRIAHTLGAHCIYLDPYVENVIDNLRNIATAFAYEHCTG